MTRIQTAWQLLIHIFKHPPYLNPCVSFHFYNVATSNRYVLQKPASLYYGCFQSAEFVQQQWIVLRNKVEWLASPSYKQPSLEEDASICHGKESHAPVLRQSVNSFYPITRIHNLSYHHGSLTYCESGRGYTPVMGHFGAMTELFIITQKDMGRLYDLVYTKPFFYGGMNYKKDLSLSNSNCDNF